MYTIPVYKKARLKWFCNGLCGVYKRRQKKKGRGNDMREENKTLASEIVKEQQEVIKSILTELELVENDLEKTEFIISEIGDLTTRIPKTQEETLLFARDMTRMNILAHIALDYLGKTGNKVCELRERMEEYEL